MNIKDENLQEKILRSLDSGQVFSDKAKLSAHHLVSDWLDSLWCMEYLPLFEKNYLDSVKKIRNEEWTLERLKYVRIMNNCYIPADKSVHHVAIKQFLHL